MSTLTLTCRTAGCGNADLPIVVEVAVDEVTGQPVPPGAAFCGACGEPIVDVVV